MAFEIDSEKLQTFYLHVLKASKKYHEKQIARKQVIKQLTGLKKFKVNKKYLTKIDELEKSIHHLVNKEKRILKAQKEETLFQRELKEKITALEAKLGTVLESHKSREQKIKTLEKRIDARLKKREAYADVQNEVTRLEVIYRKLKNKGETSPQMLQGVESRINELKLRLRSV